MKTINLKSGTRLPLMNLKGKDYLGVAYRLVWFREEHPDWSIETDFIVMNEINAVCKATVKDVSGRVIATAHKEESLKDFPLGYREKAETGAIGRCLGLIGYGTQYEPDFDEGERVVDSPIGAGGVHPENPEMGDGHNKDQGYRIPFGKFAKRSLEEIPTEELRGYVNYLEGKAAKENKPITGVVADFIERAVAHVIAIEKGGFDTNFDQGISR